MSFSEIITNTIEDTIKLYISKISTEYNLNQTELYKLWNDNSIVKSTKEDVVDPELMKLSKKELSEICKSKKLPVSGTKIDLIKRILDTENKTQTKLVTKNQPQKSTQPEIIKKLVDKIPVIQIKRNVHGNYVHEITQFVINNTTRKVYGKQNEDGSISELTAVDINLCHQYKFAYDIPENLDKKDDNEDDNDLEEELEDELEEELEEELEDTNELDDLDDEDIIEDDDIEEYYEDE